MLYFSRWKITIISLLVLAGVVFSFPNLLSKEQREKWLPDFMPAMALGLDLQGGVHLMMKVDRNDLIKSRMQALEDDVRASLREDRNIRYRQKLASTTELDVQLTDPNDVEKARALLKNVVAPVAGGLFGQSAVQEIELEDAGNGLLKLTFTDPGINNALRRAVQQSIEVVRNRIDQLGTTEPLVQRQGDDRIVLQVPGLNDPQRLKDLIGQTAKLTFHLVDTEHDVNAAIEGRPPAGDVVMFEETDPPTPYLLQSRVIVSGENLVDAQPGFDQRTNEPVVNFRFDAKGGAIFGKVTSENVGKPFAIVLDEEVISAPAIREPILGGSGQISGNFTVEGANDLAVLLRAGALPAKLIFIEERTVGPSLGADSIAEGQRASIIGAVLVVLFMFVAYGTFGIIANIALAANVALIIALLSVIGATLTLPGIAGIVLTMGMAVDSNVLINERIYEDRRQGRTLIQSIDSGFRMAFATIVDANATTLIAAAVLFYLGYGPVRGFAVTLAIGIVTTVFTAYLVTRLLVALWVRIYKPKELPKRIISWVTDHATYRFMSYRMIVFPLAIAISIASVGLALTMGLNFGVDFRGGTTIEVQAKGGKQADISAIRKTLSDFNLGDVQVQGFGDGTDAMIRVESQGLGEQGEQSVVDKVRYGLQDDYDFRRVEIVGPTVSGELATKGLLAVGLALLAIMVYVWMRFEWQFALGAVIATIHDVVGTIGIFSLLQIEFNLTTIAAILTIVGYSLNDTVVVYDRIREMLRKYKKMPIPEVIDISINQTLSRTVLTSVTTLLALLSLYFFGGEVLESFSFAMIFGVLIGTFSSIFIAAPVLIYFKLRPGQMDKIEKDASKEKKATANTRPVSLG